MQQKSEGGMELLTEDLWEDHESLNEAVVISGVYASGDVVV